MCVCVCVCVCVQQCEKKLSVCIDYFRYMQLFIGFCLNICNS